MIASKQANSLYKRTKLKPISDAVLSPFREAKASYCNAEEAWTQTAFLLIQFPTWSLITHATDDEEFDPTKLPSTTIVYEFIAISYLVIYFPGLFEVFMFIDLDSQIESS